jgi:hypothetical protein
VATNRRPAHSCNYSPNLCLCFKATYIFLFAVGWWGVITNLRVIAPRSGVILISWFVLSSVKVTSDVPVTPHDAFHLFLFSQPIALTPFDVTSLPTTYTKNVQTAHAQRTSSLSEHPAFWDVTPYRLLSYRSSFTLLTEISGFRRSASEIFAADECPVSYLVVC